MKQRVAGIAVAFLALGLLCAGHSATALAAETHVFDPLLSLTGACGTSTADPVPDPGCPGGDHPPSGAFAVPKSIEAGPYGEIYVASFGKESAGGTEGRVDVFDAEGFFITELLVGNGPRDLGVDSEGNLYVYEARVGGIVQISLYEPTIYDPEAGEIEYGNAPVVAIPETVFVGGRERFLPSTNGLAVDRSTDHLLVHFGDLVAEFGSADEENKLLSDDLGEGTLSLGKWVEVDSTRGLVYASDSEPSLAESRVRVFEADPPYKLVRTIDGSTTPAGKFAATAGFVSIAVDEGSGHVFVDDLEKTKKIYEFTETGDYVSTIQYNFAYVFPSSITVDNGINSPNGALNPFGRYLFVPSGPAGVGHAYAFSPEPQVEPPTVESISVAAVTETEAEVSGTIDPNIGATNYRFEYTTQESFEEEGFASASMAGEGTLAPGQTVPIEVSAFIEALSPGTAYRVRLVAENSAGEDEGEVGFSTYPHIPLMLGCSNDGVRIGASAGLPDCRAYELVSPSSTNGRSLSSTGFSAEKFPTLGASFEGTEANFLVRGGTIPGSGGAGAFNGTPYLATRGPNGWSSTNAGPTGVESMAPLPGGVSPDQQHSFWSTGKDEEGTAVIGGQETRYVRYPDGHSELIGRGSLDVDPRAQGELITENGGHIIFRTRQVGSELPIRLEEEAPPTGTAAVYDRTPDEVTHVVSLLPGDVTPAAGEDADYEGASTDGEGIAFSAIDDAVGVNKLYLRKNNAETFEIASGSWAFAGVSDGGTRVFYVQGGNLLAFDAGTETTIPFSSSGDVTPVNVSSDGTRAYFLSPSVLGAAGANPGGDTPEAGKPNLYLSEEGALSFVGTVAGSDVERKDPNNQEEIGLGVWVEAVRSGALARETSRTIPDGSVLLFEASANLTGYDAGGSIEIYHFDSVAGTLACLSCNPTGIAPDGDASLQSSSSEVTPETPVSPYAVVGNLRADGRRVFFQSPDPLVVGDTDQLQDVYEWEAEGVGSCLRAEGCVYLISSGHSARNDFLYASSGTGDDVFFLSGDRLLASDSESTPSLYDARVNGGFPEPVAPDPCQGETCRPKLSSPPPLLAPASPAAGNDNVTRRHRCPKGKRKVKRKGKVRCVKKHQKKRVVPGGKTRRTGR
jgi:hypothetical protein